MNLELPLRGQSNPPTLAANYPENPKKSRKS